MESLLMSFLSPKPDARTTQRVRDIVSPIKSFSNTRKRLEKAQVLCRHGDCN